jgi:hypothetical protein
VDFGNYNNDNKRILVWSSVEEPHHVGAVPVPGGSNDLAPALTPFLRLKVYIYCTEVENKTINLYAAPAPERKVMQLRLQQGK